MSETKQPESKQEEYRVLARKYRPQNFDELIGQDALIRTLKNAIESGRIAHAFMLTGVRGVGKTTTARIIAKALNYTGANGKSGPTTGSTDDCDLCKAISEDRHPDIIEMDAASRTGVDDIREILDGVRYAPTEARYKIYIIDEVHMLSKNAFNALLKTLEEPPEHVKFIFATTEIRKVPITVISRCQRFDLRRVDVPTLTEHFKNICVSEKVEVEDEAVSLIARAADGSVRDGLSLLDQAMAFDGKNITGQQIKNMLGLADRARSLDLLEHALSGNMSEALVIMDDMYAGGADPVALIQDLLGLSHLLTKLRAVPSAQDAKHAMAADEVKRVADMAKNISMPSLGKTWQILLKGLNEVQSAPNPQNAAEMIIIRLTYAADLPDPADLIKRLQNQPKATMPGSSISNSPPVSAKESAPVAVNAPIGNVRAATQAATEVAPQSFIETETMISSLADVVYCLEQAGEILLANQIYQFVHLVKLEEGRIEISIDEYASPRLAQNMGKYLGEITGRRWLISVTRTTGDCTLLKQAEEKQSSEFARVMELPVIRKIIDIFPEAKLTEIIPTETKKVIDK